MRAWLMESYDGVEKLRLTEVADPVPAPGEVLIKLDYAALNPADAFLAQRMYPAKPAMPHVLGRDGVGTVVAVGAGVTKPRINDYVGILRCDAGVECWGTLAELVKVPAVSVAPLPQGWQPEEMAGAPLVYLTAWQALTQWSEPPAPLKPGSVVLVTGASGGVGAASVMLAKSMNLSVVALTRSSEKGERLKALGADFVFDPEEKDLFKRVLAALAPKRVDLAIDMVGGELFNKVLGMLGQNGRISVVGRSGGAVPEFNTAQLFFRRNRIGGVAVSNYEPQSAQDTWSEIVKRLNELKQKPIVDSVHPFAEVKAAFARLAKAPMGKVLVKVR